MTNTIKAFTLCTVALLFIVFVTFRSEAQPTEQSSLLSDSSAQEEALSHYLAGTVHEEADELLQAAVEYQLALLFDESSAAICVAIARMYNRLDHRQAALLVLEKGRSLNPRDEELLKMLADSYIRFNRQNDAADCYIELAALRELDRIELLRMAALLATNDRAEEALQVYAEYLDRFGQDADVYHKIGLIHLTRRDVEAAETTYQRLVELDPSQDRVYFVLGGFAVSRKNWVEAEKNFRRALEIDSTEIRYWINLLLSLNTQEKSTEALDAVDAALERFPNIPTLHDIRCSALERLTRYDEALEAGDRSLALDSTRLSPYMAKGYIYQELKEWFKAADAYDHALKIDPDNATLLNNYAYMLSLQNHRLEDGLSMVNHALELRPGVSSFLDTRAWLLYRLGRTKEALVEIRKAMKESDENAELYEHLGYIYQALGKTKKSVKAWRRALELDPDNEEYKRLVH